MCDYMIFLTRGQDLRGNPTTLTNTRNTHQAVTVGVIQNIFPSFRLGVQA